MMRGVTPFYRKFRAAVSDSTGKQHQEYFDTEEEAEAFILRHRPISNGNGRTNKRRNAKDLNLPVGLYQTIVRKKHVIGTYETSVIVATVSVDGKPKRKTAAYGERRTRDEAITICLKWRKEQLTKITPRKNSPQKEKPA